MMNKNCLFFCQYCGVPQSISNYVIQYYFILCGVDQFYCSNCKSINKLNQNELSSLIREVR